MHNASLANEVASRLNASIQITPKDGTALPLVPVLSWRMFGAGPESTCAVGYDRLAADLYDIRQWARLHPGRIAALQWWSGSDDDADGKPGSECKGSNISYINWLRSAHIVPPNCRHSNTY